MPAKPKLYTCHLDRGGPPVHACRRCHEALEAAGIDYDTQVFDRKRPFGLGTKGRRPELKAMTGQEKLPVLELTDGSFLIGSGDIIRWARASAPAQSPNPALD
jgi:glutathione S-transferase